jgi:hypothetical protein
VVRSKLSGSFSVPILALFNADFKIAEVDQISVPSVSLNYIEYTYSSCTINICVVYAELKGMIIETEELSVAVTFWTSIRKYWIRTSDSYQKSLIEVSVIFICSCANSGAVL